MKRVFQAVGPILRLVLVLVVVPLMPYDSFPRYKFVQLFLCKVVLDAMLTTSNCSFQFQALLALVQSNPQILQVLI
jgi:hypothetical protein